MVVRVDVEVWSEDAGCGRGIFGASFFDRGDA